MKLIIFTHLVLLLAAQIEFGISNPQPSLSFSDITSAIKNFITTGSIDAISTTTPVETATTTESTLGYNVIQNATVKTKEEEESAYKVYEAIDAEETDKATHINKTITTVSQTIANSATHEEAIALNVCQAFEDIINGILENGEGSLTDRIEQILQTIVNLSQNLDSSNLDLIIGGALTNITNKGLAESGGALATEIRLKLLANAVTALANIHVLNDLVDKIKARTSVAYKPTYIHMLVDINKNLKDTGAELTDAYDNGNIAYVPVTESVNTTVNEIISALRQGVAELDTAMEALENTKGGIVIDTIEAYQQVGVVIAGSVIGDTGSGISSSIAGAMGNVADYIIAAAKSMFPGLASIFDRLVANAGGSLAASFLSCVTTEIEKLQYYRNKCLEKIDELEAERDSGAISVSNLKDTVLLTGDTEMSYKTAKFRLSVCETTQAALTANVVLPLILKMASLID